ncbi:alpha/beta-hydrolase [Coprinellus micaceus]|uniref:Alpha/beta-hydrolase n=1 Tax=Coprinellus micaceus TaxID=71717 RepID=A0A4Y7SIJ3_COPMI|nr:alpha/beta-hydrolase [Coprinellus micaceus]
MVYYNLKPLDCPVILLRGWGTKTCDPSHRTWSHIEAYLTGTGVPYVVPYYHRFGSIEERAQSVIDQIRQLYPQWRVHLVGHSMGGLVARAIAARCNLPFKVLTVTTFGSPHRGLKYLGKLPGMDGDGKLAALIREVFGSDFGGVCNITTEFMARFNQTTLNNPTVRYFSWAGHLRFYQIKYAAMLAFVSQFHRHSDGIVGTESAAWGPDLGPGVHLGTVEGLSHSKIVSAELFANSIPYLRSAELWR